MKKKKVDKVVFLPSEGRREGGEGNKSGGKDKKNEKKKNKTKFSFYTE